MLRRAYNKMMTYADHPRAMWALLIVTFTESSFFPIPPDPLFLAIAVNRPKKVWRLAAICTLTSVLGGYLGYYIGYALYESVGVWIVNSFGMQEGFVKIQADFQKWGFWIVALKGLTPIPYKIVTIAAGVGKLDLVTFFFASILARGFRFYSMAVVLWYFPGTKDFIERNLNTVFVVALVVLIFGFVVLPYLF